jgi:radical SAM protein with 4Fe4S-binding SPASM domain
VREFGDPLMVFTGGDPLKRPDIYELLGRSVSLGLRTTITPSATPLLSADAIERIQGAGVSRMAVSLDGDDAATHDGFRGVEGSFARTVFALDHARHIGLETQVNTTVTRRNLDQLESIARIVGEKSAQLWNVFFLVATGRATEGLDLTAEEYEDVFKFLYRTSRTTSFDIKTTEAQHYRRFVAQQRKQNGGPRDSRAEGPIQRQAGINDGKGLVFISHTGDVYPSGFLPVNAGNLRDNTLADLYRGTSLFKMLRDADSLEGKCGDCNYRNLCGGSRSRAYALTGNVFAEDPRCVYQPAA